MDSSTSERITSTLLAHPWTLNPVQAIDFAAWLCGIDEGRAKGLHDLTPGERADVLGRLQNCTNARSLKDEWLGARYAARVIPTSAQVIEEGESWLR